MSGASEMLERRDYNCLTAMRWIVRNSREQRQRLRNFRRLPEAEVIQRLRENGYSTEGDHFERAVRLFRAILRMTGYLEEVPCNPDVDEGGAEGRAYGVHVDSTDLSDEGGEPIVPTSSSVSTGTFASITTTTVTTNAIVNQGLPQAHW